jgi:hypothetical protein
MQVICGHRLSVTALAWILMIVAAPLSLALAAQDKQEMMASEEQKTGVLDAPQAPEGESTEKLRKAAQNPVASLISFPIQENWNFGIGQSDRVQNVMNIQPVIPLSFGNNWNLIVRWISPVTYQPVGVQGPSNATVQSGYYGLGDM